MLNAACVKKNGGFYPKELAAHRSPLASLSPEYLCILLITHNLTAKWTKCIFSLNNPSRVHEQHIFLISSFPYITWRLIHRREGELQLQLLSQCACGYFERACGTATLLRGHFLGFSFEENCVAVKLSLMQNDIEGLNHLSKSSAWTPVFLCMLLAYQLLHWSHSVSSTLWGVQHFEFCSHSPPREDNWNNLHTGWAAQLQATLFPHCRSALIAF